MIYRKTLRCNNMISVNLVITILSHNMCEKRGVAYKCSQLSLNNLLWVWFISITLLNIKNSNIYVDKIAITWT